MSEKQFETFLIENLREWLEGRVKAGDRFQFRSTDPENTVKLLQELHETADGHIEDGETNLDYLQVGAIRVLIAGHAEQSDVDAGCYTDNYLAKLRDDVVDWGYALLMVHNSSLDTITNSTFDLAGHGAVWSVSGIKQKLEGQINGDMSNHETSRCLLDLQARIVEADNASVFGYRGLYESIKDGDLRFDELGLFNDPKLTDGWSSQSEHFNRKQIEKRLEENRKLRSEIEFEVEHHSEELEDRLNQFGAKFVKNNFGNDSDKWQSLTFDEYTAEIEKQKKQALEFDSLSTINSNDSLQHRSKTEKGAGLRDIHVLLEADQSSDSFSLAIKFSGSNTERQQFNIIHPAGKPKYVGFDHRRHGAKTTLTVTGPVLSEPVFFTVNLARELNSERYKFHCVVIPKGAFYLEDIANQFLVNRTKQALLLQAVQPTITINPDIDAVRALADNQECVDIAQYGQLDFQQLYDESDEVRFQLKSGDTELQIMVEGEPAKQSLVLPLLADTSRTKHLLSDDYYAIYKRSKGTVVLDNQEIRQLFLREQLLNIEHAFIEEEVVFWNQDIEDGTRADELKALGLTDLYESYVAFLRHFKANNRRTLPSLEGWGETVTALATNYINAYLNHLESLEPGKTLSHGDKFVMKLGLSRMTDSEDGREKHYLTPFHPVVLSYYLNLIEAIREDSDDSSYKGLPNVTLKRLTPRGLVPHLYDAEQGYSYTQVVETNPFWLEIVPREDSSFEYVTKLVRHKIEEFTETFTQLFEEVPAAPILINSINNAENRELFKGILSYYIDQLDDGRHIHVNLYDDDEVETEFDIFAEMATYDDIKDRYDLDKGAAKRNTDTIVDVLRTHLSFSKFRNGQVDSQKYAHLSFFKNNQVVDPRNNNIDEHISGVACGGLLVGESSLKENESYFTGVGMKGVDCSDKPHLKIAKIFGRLWRPSIVSGDTYDDNSAIRLSVSASVKEQLQRSYDSSVWVTIIDPKVTLDFFRDNQDVILIHYSDQYTSSSGYDAITVTKQSELYKNVLGAAGESLIHEFNAFNGEWLLQMVNDEDTEKLGKYGVIAAYKSVAAMLSQSDICWVPLSVAEMIRVAGNIGLAMSDSDFSRHNFNIKQGVISDDILFAGFKDGKLYLLPVEAKAGKNPPIDKARTQAVELKQYMETILGQDNLAGRLFRGLFIRQILLQVEKYQLYQVFEDTHFDSFLAEREAWLDGTYSIAQLVDYPQAMVVAFLNGDSCFKETYEESEGILTAEIPINSMNGLVHTPFKSLKEKIRTGSSLRVPEIYFLKPQKSVPSVESKTIEVTTEGSNDSTPPELVTNELNPKQPPTGDISQSRVLIGSDLGGDGEVYWEYGSSQLANRHLIVFGRSGQGKTYCIQGILIELAKAKIKPLIIDYTNGFLPNHLEPEFNDFVNPKSSFLAQSPLGISPFRKQAQDFGGVMLEEKDHIIAARIASVFNQVYSTIGEQQLATLTNVIENGVAQHGSKYNFTSMLDDLYEEGKTGESLANKLSTMVKSNLFDETDHQGWGEIFKTSDSGVQVIQLASFSRDIMQIATEFILWDLYAYACANGNKNSPLPIVLDEVQNLDHSLESPLGKMLTEGRKYGLSLILATQTLSMLSKEEQDRIFQASHKLFFAPAETETNTYAKLLEQSIPGTERKMWIKELSRLQKGECISVGLHLDAHGKAVHGAKVVKVATLPERLKNMEEPV